MDGDRELLRATFDFASRIYDLARPGYPDELFDDLARLAKLRPAARLLEVGSGTGKATIPLARRGYQITGLEIGANLAERARQNLAGFADVQILRSAFESWRPPAGVT